LSAGRLLWIGSCGAAGFGLGLYLAAGEGAWGGYGYGLLGAGIGVIFALFPLEMLLGAMFR
jgi:hypothetical protein